MNRFGRRRRRPESHERCVFTSFTEHEQRARPVQVARSKWNTRKNWIYFGQLARLNTLTCPRCTFVHANGSMTASHRMIFCSTDFCVERCWLHEPKHPSPTGPTKKTEIFLVIWRPNKHTPVTYMHTSSVQRSQRAYIVKMPHWPTVLVSVRIRFQLGRS